MLPFGSLKEVEVSLSSCRGCFSSFVGGFLFTLCSFFLIQVVVVLDLEPLTQIWTLGIFFQLDLVCHVQDLAFLFLGFQIYYFFTQIRTLCCSSVVPPTMLGLFQTWPNVVISLTQAWYQSRCSVQIAIYRPMAPATASCYSNCCVESVFFICSKLCGLAM